MAKLIKFFLWSFITLIVVIILAAVLIPVLIDPNDYKDEISQQVYNTTGRTLSIEGDIDIAVSLPLSVSLELGKILLSNAKGFTDKPFAQMQGASLHVAILPLINENRLDIGEIKLSNMELNLIKNKQGQTNWDDLSAGKEAAPKDSMAKTEVTSKNNVKTSIPAINIAGLSIENAKISWTDEQANQKTNLSKTNLTISKLVEDTPFKIQLSTHISSSDPAIEGDFTLQSNPVVSLSKNHFQLDKTLLTLDLTGKTLPGGANKTTLSGDITFDGKSQTLDIKNMQLSSYDMNVNGLFHADKLDTAAQYSGQISIDTFSPKTLAATLGNALPAMKEKQALTSANAKMTFKGDQNKVTLSTLEANLDMTALTGNAVISHFEKPHYAFDLKLNQLDYYAMAEAASSPTPTKSAKSTKPASTTKKKTAAAKKTPAAAKQSSAIFPLETLRQLNIDGKLTIGQFIAAKAKMSNVVIVLKGKKGVVQLAPLKAQLYSGSINLNTTIDARGKTPKLKIVNELKHVQIGDLLQATTGTQEFTGAANISANITTSGNDQDRLLKNTNGTAKLLVTDGHIKKLDILDTIRKADALLKGRKAPTKFTELKGTLKIKNGVIHNNDLSSQSPVMKLTGKGYIDLPKEYMDYTLLVKLLNSIKIDKNTEGTDYKGKEFPYTIKGKFSDLSEDANLSKVLKKEVKKKAEKEINKQLEKKFGKKFKGLIKF